MSKSLKFVAVVLFLVLVLAALSFLLYTGFGRYPPRGFMATQGNASPETETAGTVSPDPSVDSAGTSGLPLPSVDNDSAAEPVLSDLVADTGEDSRIAELVDLRMRAGEWEQALSLCRELVEKHPDDNSLRIRMAASLATLGQLNEAYREAAGVIARRPDDVRAQMLVAEVALRVGLPSLAVAHADRAVALRPDVVAGRKLLAKALLAEGSLDRAEAELQSLLSVRPDDAELLINIGTLYAQRGARDQARVALEKAVELEPDSPAPHMAIAQFLLTGGDLAEAMNAYRTVLELAPAHAMALNNLAALLGEDEAGVEEGVQLARRAWQVSPGVPQIADTLGWLHLKAGDLERALAMLAFAVQRSPREATFRYHLGAALLELGRPQEAERQLEAALAPESLFPEEADARRLLQRIRETH